MTKLKTINLTVEEIEKAAPGAIPDGEDIYILEDFSNIIEILDIKISNIRYSENKEYAILSFSKDNMKFKFENKIYSYNNKYFIFKVLKKIFKAIAIWQSDLKELKRILIDNNFFFKEEEVIKLLNEIGFDSKVEHLVRDINETYKESKDLKDFLICFKFLDYY